jgi:hypothetical protein
MKIMVRVKRRSGEDAQMEMESDEDRDAEGETVSMLDSQERREELKNFDRQRIRSELAGLARKHKELESTDEESGDEQSTGVPYQQPTRHRGTCSDARTDRRTFAQKTTPVSAHQPVATTSSSTYPASIGLFRPFDLPHSLLHLPCETRSR